MDGNMFRNDAECGRATWRRAYSCLVSSQPPSTALVGSIGTYNWNFRIRIGTELCRIKQSLIIQDDQLL
jgi:hypothetical protein